MLDMLLCYGFAANMIRAHAHGCRRRRRHQANRGAELAAGRKSSNLYQQARRLTCKFNLI